MDLQQLPEPVRTALEARDVPALLTALSAALGSGALPAARPEAARLIVRAVTEPHADALHQALHPWGDV